MMSLKDKLYTQRLQAEQNRSAEQVGIMHDATERLKKQGIENTALRKGDKIPFFSLPNAQGEPIAIESLVEQGPVILTFYRGSWCPYCNLELRAYQQHLNTIQTMGAQLVAISPEQPDSSLSNKEKLELTFEVLSDKGNEVARKFGLVFKMPSDLIDVYRQLGTDITKNNGDNTWELPVPATYVITRDAQIAFAYINADYLERIDPQDVIEALKNVA